MFPGVPDPLSDVCDELFIHTLSGAAAVWINSHDCREPVEEALFATRYSHSRASWLVSNRQFFK